MPCTSDKQFLYQLIISQLYYDGYRPHASLLEEAVLETHQAVLPSDNLRSLLMACSNTVRTADVIFSNWSKAKKCSETPELSSQPLGQSLLQLYSNSLQPSNNNSTTYDQVLKQQQKGSQTRPNQRQQQQNVQRQIHQQQKQQIKQIQQQQIQQQIQQQQQGSAQTIQTPIINIAPFQYNPTDPVVTSQQVISNIQKNLQPPRNNSASSTPHSPLQNPPKRAKTTISSSPITPSPADTDILSSQCGLTLPLTTFSEYTNELNDVLQVSSEILNITSSPKNSKEEANPSSPIDVTAFLNPGGNHGNKDVAMITPPTINTSPISNPESKPEPMEQEISETQDLLEKLQSLSSSELTDTSILQKLSPSQINLLTSHLESSQVSVPAHLAPQLTPQEQQTSPRDTTDSNSSESLQPNENSIFTLGGLNKEELSLELEEILANVEKSQTEDQANDQEYDRLRKPTISYPAMIAMSILNSDSKRLLLGDIYRYIMEKYPYYRLEGQGWRNSIRHNLSLNDCFMKAGRAESGKGHYWTVRPDSIKEFQNGGYRRRLRRTCTRGGSLSMSTLPTATGDATLSRPQISIAPFITQLNKPEIFSPSSSPPNVKAEQDEQHT